MKKRKYLILGFIILLLLTAAILLCLRGTDMHGSASSPSPPPSASPSPTPGLSLYDLDKNGNLSDLLADGDPDDIILTIYSMIPNTLTFVPVSVESLVNGSFDHKAVIGNSLLSDHVDLLDQINNAVLIPVEENYILTIRLCYVLENTITGKTFDVAFGGYIYSYYSYYAISAGCILVNGIAVKEDKAFFDIIRPFLSQDMVDKLERFYMMQPD